MDATRYAQDMNFTCVASEIQVSFTLKLILIPVLVAEATR